MKFRGRARSRPARGRCQKSLRKTGKVPHHNAEQPDTTPNNDETDRHGAVPYIRISVDAMASAAIKSPEVTQCLGTGLPTAQGDERSTIASGKDDAGAIFA